MVEYIACLPPVSNNVVMTAKTYVETKRKSVFIDCKAFDWPEDLEYLEI